MTISYKTNGKLCTKSLTEWYFGKTFVKNLTEASTKICKTTGQTTFKYWQDGTGYLTIEIKFKNNINRRIK